MENLHVRDEYLILMNKYHNRKDLSIYETIEFLNQNIFGIPKITSNIFKRLDHNLWRH